MLSRSPRARCYAAHVGDELDAQIAEMRRTQARRGMAWFGATAIGLFVLGAVVIVYSLTGGGGWNTFVGSHLLGVGIAIAIGGVMCLVIARRFARSQ